MSQTQKIMSDRDFQQTLKLSFNDVDASLTTTGFLIGKVGRKVEVTISTTTVLNDTATYTFSEDYGANILYSYELVFTNGGRSQLISATRIA